MFHLTQIEHKYSLRSAQYVGEGRLGEEDRGRVKALPRHRGSTQEREKVSGGKGSGGEGEWGEGACGEKERKMRGDELNKCSISLRIQFFVIQIYSYQSIFYPYWSSRDNSKSNLACRSFRNQ